MSRYLQIWIILGVLITSGCSGTKHYYKKGLQLEEAGFRKDAAEMYYKSLQRNRSNIDAKIGLKKTGQLVLDDKLGEFYKQYNLEKHKEAIYAFRNADAYRRQIAAIGVELDWPEHYQGYYDETKAIYLDELYLKGQEAMLQDDYDQAQAYFDEIMNIDASYKDAAQLKMDSVLEPLYRSGVRSMEAGDYKDAYFTFLKVSRKEKGYKLTPQYLAESKEKATISIGMFPIKTTAGVLTPAEKIYAYAMSEMVNSRQPLLRIVDRSNLEALLEEQKIGLSGLIDETTSAEAGKLIGLQAIVLCNLIKANSVDGGVVHQSKYAYEGYKVRRYNPTNKTYYNVTRYRKVTYLEGQGASQVDYSLHYQLISTETGEVLMSDVVNVNLEDKVFFRGYEGNHNNLFPTMPSGSAIPQGTSRWRRAFRNRRTLKSSSDLMTSACQEIARKVANGVVGYVTK